jgi:enoyl-CoA hydratase
VDVSENQGVRAAVTERDGPFDDYSQAPADERPNPKNVIRP